MKFSFAPEQANMSVQATVPREQTPLNEDLMTKWRNQNWFIKKILSEKKI